MDSFGGISVQREMSSRAFLINAFCFRRDKNDVFGTKIGQQGISEMDKKALINSGKTTVPLE